ncbi:hypothetical protein [Umezawaea sp.]|uniref:hypothetical protein n=1 Tax=Umezawaea sp. TaxID=1955258 RepID=UPI002ED1E37D
MGFDDVRGTGGTLLTRTTTGPRLDGPDADCRTAVGGRVVPVVETEDVGGTYGEFVADDELAAILYRPDPRVFGAAAEESAVPALQGGLRDRLAAVADVRAERALVAP